MSRGIETMSGTVFSVSRRLEPNDVHPLPWGSFVMENSAGGKTEFEGNIPQLFSGESVRISVGAKKNSGRMTCEDFLEPPQAPSSRAALGVFLNSLRSKIGEKKSEYLADEYGADIYGILDDMSSYLEKKGALLCNKNFEHLRERSIREKPNFTENQILNLVLKWGEYKKKRDLLSFLFECGVPLHLDRAAEKRFGPSAGATLGGDPTLLLEICKTFNWEKMEGMVSKAYPDAETCARKIASGLIRRELNQFVIEGDSCLPKEAFLKRVLDSVSKTKMNGKISLEHLDAALLEDAAAGGDSDETDEASPLSPVIVRNASGEVFVFRKNIRDAEETVAKSIAKILEAGSGRNAATIDADEKALRAWEVSSGKVLNKEQREAVSVALSSPVSVIHGGPGTGKTLVASCLKSILEARGESATECAPTGRAARNMSRQASTVHYAAGIVADEGAGSGCFADGRVFLDEAGMLDVHVAREFFGKLLSSGSRAVLFGDVMQIPSVGPGRVLSSIIESGAVPCVKLSRKERYGNSKVIDFLSFLENLPDGESGGPGVAANAPDLSGLYQASRLPFDKEREEIERRVRESIGAFLDAGVDRNEIAVLTPTNSWAESIGKFVGEMLNTSGSGLGEKNGFRVGDRVMYTRNNHGNRLCNGSLGVVTEVSEDSIFVEYNGLGGIEHSFREALSGKELIRAWCITIHKSQGSEFDAAVVVLPSMRQHPEMVTRSLLYTAVSRARKFCAVVGDEGLFMDAVSNRFGRVRGSMLGEAIAAHSGTRTAASVVNEVDEVSERAPESEIMSGNLNVSKNRIKTVLDAVGRRIAGAFFGIARIRDKARNKTG